MCCRIVWESTGEIMMGSLKIWRTTYKIKVSPTCIIIKMGTRFFLRSWVCVLIPQSKIKSALWSFMSQAPSSTAKNGRKFQEKTILVLLDHLIVAFRRLTSQRKGNKTTKIDSLFLHIIFSISFIGIKNYNQYNNQYLMPFRPKMWTSPTKLTVK